MKTGLMIWITSLWILVGCSHHSQVREDRSFGQGQERWHKRFPWQGERMKFRVMLGQMEVMELSLEAGKVGKAKDGTRYIGLEGKGYSKGVFGLTYPIKDRALTFIDPYSWQPLYAIKSFKEGKKDRKYYVHYWQEERYADVEKHRRKKVIHVEVPIPQKTYDSISLIYIIRAMSLKSGEQHTWLSFDGWKMNHMYFVVQDLEEVSTPLGVFKAYKVDLFRELLKSHAPQGILSGIFEDPVLTVIKARKYVGSVWIEPLGEHRLIQMTMELKMGNILIQLIEYHLPEAI